MRETTYEYARHAFYSGEAICNGSGEPVNPIYMLYEMPGPAHGKLAKPLTAYCGECDQHVAMVPREFDAAPVNPSR